MARCGRNKGNESRNLHKLIHSQGKTFPVEVVSEPVPVRILAGKPRVGTVNYPCLLLSAWIKALFDAGGQMLLGGYSLLRGEANYRALFARFWHRFRQCRPDLELYSEEFDQSLCIPIAIHGDEGRGKLKRPVMIVSYQPLISHRGDGYTNATALLGISKPQPVTGHCII